MSQSVVYHNCNMCQKVLSGYDGNTNMYYTKDEYWVTRKELVQDEDGFIDYTEFVATCKPCYAPRLIQLSRNVKNA